MPLPQTLTLLLPLWEDPDDGGGTPEVKARFSVRVKVRVKEWSVENSP